MISREDVERAATKLAGARRVTVLTGAGVSAGSGVPTFRGAGGLWRRFRPEELATREAFVRDNRTVWEWYAWRRSLVANARPNAAHDVLAGWSRRFPVFALVTQNVDGLHERAGTRGLVPFHGSLWTLRCFDACGARPDGWEDLAVPLPEIPPRCPDCGGVARPGVVWFGEPIPAKALAGAGAAVRCDVFVIVGTSSLVTPAASLAAEAGSRGAFTIEVNLEPTPSSPGVDLAIEGKAEEILPEIDRLLRC